MKRIIGLFLLTAVLSTHTPVHAQTENASLRVLVEALGDHREQVRRYVSIALGLFEDIEVVDDNPNVYIHIIVRELVTNKGNRLGYVMTSASSEIVEMNIEGGKPFIVSDYSGLWLEVGPDIYDLSEQCVKAINASVFERMRAEKAKAE
jgi:hypothetical protein